MKCFFTRFPKDMRAGRRGTTMHRKLWQGSAGPSTRFLHQIDTAHTYQKTPGCGWCLRRWEGNCRMPEIPRHFMNCPKKSKTLRDVPMKKDIWSCSSRFRSGISLSATARRRLMKFWKPISGCSCRLNGKEPKDLRNSVIAYGNT